MVDFTSFDQQVDTVSQYDWFKGTGKDQYGRHIVYCSRMDYLTISKIPDKIDGKQVVFHYHYPQLNYVYHEPLTIKQVEPKAKPAPKVEEIEVSVPDIDYLIKELDQLEKMCGTNILDAIFYEVHDRHNAVTNLSEKYPLVRDKMEELYTEFGFDLIYEEMDG